jgi:pimeloyl-ACP methyl ester carboxylesterase
MKNLIPFAGILCLVSCQPLPSPVTTCCQTTFQSADSLTIVSDEYSVNKEAPILLLFHQGGSNVQGEYSSIIPRLTNRGYNVLAVDLRTGGQYYGEYNRTVAGRSDYGFTANYDYCGAYPDLEAALAYVQESSFTGPVILWGSSFSASLVVQLATNHAKDVAGVLAFSPASGNAMEGCKPEPFMDDLPMPLLLLRPASELENESALRQFATADSLGHQTFVASPGVHGASMLVKERAGGEVTATWERVWAFLDEVALADQ